MKPILIPLSLATLFALLALGGCSAPADEALAPIDLGGDAQPITFDLAQAGDLAHLPSADLAEPITPDMAQAPADLAPACGEIGQACCPANACNVRADGINVKCMRSQATGTIACEQANNPGSCGGYNEPACSTMNAHWCGYNTALGCFLDQSPCKVCSS